MYKCPNCAGELTFIPERGILKCQFCDSEFSPDAVSEEESTKQDSLNKTRKNAEEQKLPEGTVYTCSQCGASLFTTEETGVTFCSYCGSQAFLKSRVMGEEEIAPDMIIPFRISKEKCQELYSKKIKSAWFLPKEMRADSEIEKFRGIYMPCWVYNGDADISGSFRTQHTTRAGDYDLIETYQVDANGTGVYEGYLEDSSASFPDGIMRDIAPFPQNEAQSFNDKYMTGFYADIGTVPSKVYEGEVHACMTANIRDDLAKESQCRRYGVSGGEIYSGADIHTRIKEVKKGYVPVWFLSNKNKLTGRMSYAVINGVTGKIHADLPIDMKKYLLVSLGIAVICFLFLQFFTMKPEVMLGVVLFLLAILFFFASKMIRTQYIKEQGLDDPGLQFLKGKSVSMSAEGSKAKVKKKKSGARWVLIAVAILFVAPVVLVLLEQLFDMEISAIGTLIIVGIFIYFTCRGSFKKKAAPGNEQTIKMKMDNVHLPFHVFLSSTALPLIGLLAGLAVMIAEPAHDLYYYAAVVFDCVMLILTMLHFVRSSNRLASRKPAQLGKRGGDEQDA